MKRLFGTSALALLVLVLGCSASSDWERVPVTGTAKLDGQPYNGGINFRPTDGTSGPATMTQVVDGAFGFDRRTGPVAGAHRAILAGKNAAGVSTLVTVPDAEPFEMNLEFTLPEIDPEAKAVRSELEEGAHPK